MLGVPCTTTMRALETPLPVYQGRGRQPKVPWPSVTQWRQSLFPTAWRRLTVRDGEQGPVAIEMVTRRVQTRIERKRTGPEEWLVVNRRPLSDDGTLEPCASRDATDQDGRYRYCYYLTPPDGGEGGARSRRLGNWRASARRAPAWKRAAKEAKARGTWMRIRCAPGRAGITLWRCHCWQYGS
jgi:hypothetical protein